LGNDRDEERGIDRDNASAPMMKNRLELNPLKGHGGDGIDLQRVQGKNLKGERGERIDSDPAFLGVAVLGKGEASVE